MTKTKKYITIVAVAMSLLLIALALTAIFTHGFKDNMSKAGEINGGMVVDPLEDEDYGVSFVSTIIPKEQYADYGISPIAETAQQITATITPSNAEYKVLDWSVAWESGTSGKFGNGKNVTDYVKVTPTSDGALTANLECKQAFGETIILTASLRNFPNIKGTRKVQYQQKLDGSGLKIEYTNSSYASANTTWTFSDAVYMDSEYFSNNTLSFPKGGSTFAEFKDYYSAAGSKKGSYKVTATIKGTNVYTKPMDVGAVKLSFRLHTKSTYNTVISGANGVYPDSKFDDDLVDGNTACVIATGNGATATLTGFDFVNFFCLENSSSLNWGLYKQLFANKPQNVFFMNIDAVVNGVNVSCGVYSVSIDASSLGTFASSVSIGSADIVY